MASEATSLGGEIATKVTCTFFHQFRELRPNVDRVIAIGGKVYTEVTSAGGAAITLATSGAGVVTSFAGSVYTVATSVAGTAATGSASGYALKAVISRAKANDLIAGTRLWRMSVRYMSQHLCLQHWLLQLVECCSVLGWHFNDSCMMFRRSALLPYLGLIHLLLLSYLFHSALVHTTFY